MNLHIVPDNVFINKFCDNLQELSILSNNRMVVRTNEGKLKFVTHNLPFSRLYSTAFQSLCGETEKYDRVFIHQFSPLLYRWAAAHEFRELNWMVWGADLYNLPTVETNLYEPLTLANYVKKYFSLQKVLYRLKVFLLHHRHQASAYAKVRGVLTWMRTEYDFARRQLPALDARHLFFFYENQLPYQALNKMMEEGGSVRNGGVPTYILGNSASPELNHLDAVAWMHRHGVRANLQVPVSYGNRRYADFLKKNLSLYKGGKIEFVDRYMSLEDYVRFLYKADGLIMNNIRPQGYGNIFMMMYLRKPVFLNEKNLSIDDLNERGLNWSPLKEIGEPPTADLEVNQSAVLKLLSHQTLLKVYAGLFS